LEPYREAERIDVRFTITDVSTNRQEVWLTLGLFPLTDRVPNRPDPPPSILSGRQTSHDIDRGVWTCFIFSGLYVESITSSKPQESVSADASAAKEVYLL